MPRKHRCLAALVECERRRNEIMFVNRAFEDLRNFTAACMGNKKTAYGIA